MPAQTQGKGKLGQSIQGRAVKNSGNSHKQSSGIPRDANCVEDPKERLESTRPPWAASSRLRRKYHQQGKLSESKFA